MAAKLLSLLHTSYPHLAKRAIEMNEADNFKMYVKKRKSGDDNEEAKGSNSGGSSSKKAKTTA